MAEEEGQRIQDVSGSEPVYDFYCELCKEDGKMLEAEGYCVDCGEYLCSTCYTHHRRSRSSRHHVLMDKEEMPKDTPLSPDRVNKDISKKCEYHPGKPVEYYCCSHDILACSTCCFKDHRNCSDVENIPEKAESVMESQDYKDFVQLLNQFNQRFCSNLKLVQGNITKSQNWCSEVAKSLQKFREEINAKLDELEKSFLTQTEELQKEEESKLMKVSDKITTSLEQVETITNELDHLQSDMKVCELYIKLKESKRRAKEIKVEFVEAEKENAINEYTFDSNTKLKECLNSKNGLGMLSLHDSVTTVSMVQPHDNFANTIATYVSDIDVKLKMKNTDCWITGSAAVSKNRLLIVDNDNYRVKLIDTQSNKMISELTVSSHPWDITLINRNQAAVTLYSSRKILLLNVSDTLTLKREIHVSGLCEGVAYSKNRLVVTYVDNPRLEILDLSGKVIKRVREDRDGNQLFVYPQYVCVSKDEETIYVSDRDSNAVTSLTFEGKVKSVYRDNELKNPRKVCVDSHDNVYVCGRDSRNIQMLTAGLSKIKVILTNVDGLDSSVCSVSHCQGTNRLYVGMENKNVKVFQLSQQ